MKLVIKTLMVQYLEEGGGDEECSDRIYPFGFEGAAVQQLMASREAHALHLKPIKEVEGGENKHSTAACRRHELVEAMSIPKTRVDVKLEDCEGVQ